VGGLDEGLSMDRGLQRGAEEEKEEGGAVAA
jgi:hypothetical protein